MNHIEKYNHLYKMMHASLVKKYHSSVVADLGDSYTTEEYDACMEALIREAIEKVATNWNPVVEDEEDD